MPSPNTQPVRRFRGGRRQRKLTAARAHEFLQALSASANVSLSALTVGVGRRTIYDHIAKDPEFAKGFEDAIEKSTDALVAEARRRALDGSDSMMMFLIRARRPEYRDRLDLRHELVPKLVLRNYATGDLDAPPEDTHATRDRLRPGQTIDVTPRDTEDSSATEVPSAAARDRRVTEPHSNHPPASQDGLSAPVSADPSPVPDPKLEVDDDGDVIVEVVI